MLLFCSNVSSICKPQGKHEENVTEVYNRNEAVWKLTPPQSVQDWNYSHKATWKMLHNPLQKFLQDLAMVRIEALGRNSEGTLDFSLYSTYYVSHAI